MLKIIVHQPEKIALLLSLCSLLSPTLSGVTIHNSTRNPIVVACVQTTFKLGDRHNKLYIDPTTTREAVIDKTKVYIIPPGQFIKAPSLGERSLTTYDRDLWVSYSYDNLVRSITKPAGRNPYKNKVFYYNIGGETNPLHIVENSGSKISFILESSSNKTKLKALAEIVGEPYKDQRPQQYSLSDGEPTTEPLASTQLSPQAKKDLEKKFNRFMKLLAIPYRM